MQMKIEDNPYVEKLPFMFDINQLQQHLYDNVITLGEPIIQGGAYGGAFGGWSVLANNGTWTGGWTQGHKAMKSGGFDYKIAKELGVVHDFSHDQPTEACTGIFKEVVDQLETHGFYPRRVRTTVLQPGGQSSRHRDAPNDAYACRIHIPLVTYEGCVHTVWDDDNREYPIHMPADGSVYILHVNNQHQIVNPTDKPRYHIIMNAWDTKGIAQDESFHFEHIDVLKERVEIFNERVRTA
jgi:hypothetical protein